MFRVLLSNTANILLTSPSKDGKTTLVRKLANEISSGAAPQPLLNKKICKIDTLEILIASERSPEKLTAIVKSLFKATIPWLESGLFDMGLTPFGR